MNDNFFTVFVNQLGEATCCYYCNTELEDIEQCGSGWFINIRAADKEQAKRNAEERWFSKIIKRSVTN